MYADTFYGGNETFQGWRCLICGDIIDPVIFLHRISGDRRIPIPERNEDVVLLIRHYLKLRSAVTGRGMESQASGGI
jgi:hypothetical protein